MAPPARTHGRATFAGVMNGQAYGDALHDAMGAQAMLAQTNAGSNECSFLVPLMSGAQATEMVAPSLQLEDGIPAKQGSKTASDGKRHLKIRLRDEGHIILDINLPRCKTIMVEYEDDTIDVDIIERQVVHHPNKYNIALGVQADPASLRKSSHGDHGQEAYTFIVDSPTTKEKTTSLWQALSPIQ